MTTIGTATSILVAFGKAKKNVIDFIYDYIKDHGGCVILYGNVLPYRDNFVRADSVTCAPDGGVILRTPGGDLELDWHDINTYISILSILSVMRW